MSGSKAPRKRHRILTRRGEAALHAPRLHAASGATDEVIFENSRQRLRFMIGDVRDYSSVAARPRTPTSSSAPPHSSRCRAASTSPGRPCRTNIEGAENLVRAIAEFDLPVETGHGHHDRQGVQAGQRDGHDQGHPGAGLHRRQHPRAQDPLHLRPLRQRTRVSRFGRPALSRPDRRGRPCHHHYRGHDPLPAHPRRRGRHHLRCGSRCSTRARPTSRSARAPR